MLGSLPTEYPRPMPSLLPIFSPYFAIISPTASPCLLSHVMKLSTSKVSGDAARMNSFELSAETMLLSSLLTPRTFSTSLSVISIIKME